MSNSFVFQPNGFKSVVFTEYVERAVDRLFQTQVIDQLKNHGDLDFNLYHMEYKKSEALFTYDREKERYYVYVFLLEANLSHNSYTIGYQILKGRDPFETIKLERGQNPMVLVKDGLVEGSIYTVGNVLMANIIYSIRDDENQEEEE